MTNVVACVYLSFTLLLAGMGFELTGVGGINPTGAKLIAICHFRRAGNLLRRLAVNPVI